MTDQTYFDAHPSPYVAASFDYFRLPAEKWPLLLTRLKQMGSPLVSLTVPWRFHQPQPNTIDLRGATDARRNLVDLLSLCVALGLRCLLRPGPLAPNQAILGDGLPAWLAHAPGDAAFATALEGWLTPFSQTLAAYQWPAGPIVALALDLPATDRPAALDPKLTEVRWPIWLRKHYPSVNDLNAAYNTNYRTVSQVKFPQKWSNTPTPLEQDARAFLAEFQHDTRDRYEQLLHEAGWQIPIYPFARDHQPDLPEIITMDWPAAKPALVTLPAPIHIAPAAADISAHPTWGQAAPICAGGSVRRAFFELRHRLWQIRAAAGPAEGPLFTINFADEGGLVSAAQDSDLKVDAPTGLKPSIFQLMLTGAIINNEKLRISRGKLRGQLLLEENLAQTDLLFYLPDETTPLPAFLDDYLRPLLAIQFEALNRAASQSNHLAEMLQATAPAPATTPTAGTSRPSSPPRPIAEAKRGLREAEAALKKAMAAIGGLESGFGTLLGQPAPAAPQEAAAPLPIQAAAFEDDARNILLAVADKCAALAADLEAAGQPLQAGLDAEAALTVAQYNHLYAKAVDAAQAAQAPLIELIAELRAAIAGETLPLVAWRVHHHLQNIFDLLRWGVLRNSPTEKQNADSDAPE